jgi:uncharacterized protein YcbK (DUF882 family)
VRLTRRGLIASGLALAATTSLKAPALARPLRADLVRHLSFENLHTGERLNATYWENGAYLPDALSAVNKVLRDFRTGDIHPIAPNLLDLLVALKGTVGTAAPFQVISGYRSPKTNALLAHEGGGVAAKSLHMQGMAIDIRLSDVALPHLRDAALGLQGGGVGFYPRSDFVHVDVGRVRRWG